MNVGICLNRDSLLCKRGNEVIIPKNRELFYANIMRSEWEST